MSGCAQTNAEQPVKDGEKGTLPLVGCWDSVASSSTILWFDSETPSRRSATLYKYWSWHLGAEVVTGE